MRRKVIDHGRIVMVILLVVAMIFSSGMSALAKNAVKQPSSYRTITEIFDWGAATTKVIVYLDKPVAQNSVTKDTFEVFVSRSDERLSNPKIGEGYRTVTNAYVSDVEGNPAVRGKYAVLEMEVGPAIPLSSPLNYSSGANVWIDCEYTITQVLDIPFESGAITGLVADTLVGEVRELIDDFTFEEGIYDNINLTYASYKPAKGNGNSKPLIIWLHGGGEGGTDATIPLAANKASNFASEEIQSYFGGAYVLVPQAPTRWMAGFTGNGDGTSIYEKGLMELIEEYVSANKEIDPNRIYIGGCSNGGYLTMVMIRDYPEYFAAAFPVCEALRDTLITDDDIQKIKDIPIWFTAAKNDRTCAPTTYTIPTYNRLIEAGAENVQLSLFEDVRDTSGLYNRADGSPYQYNGHWSWIYVYNNECETTINGETTTIMEWMAAQSLNN